MTITPVNTRLNRASAFELRSKTCAMSAFLLPLHYLRLGVEKLLSMVGHSCWLLCRAFRGRRLGRPRLVLPVNFFPNKIRVYQRKSRTKLDRNPTQLFFHLQHPIIELPADHPAQHLVHCC
jgi:hypothetical protein